MASVLDSKTKLIDNYQRRVTKYPLVESGPMKTVFQDIKVTARIFSQDT